MIELLMSPKGIVLGLIFFLALIIYWQIFDLIQLLFMNEPLNKTSVVLCQLRGRQLSGWVSVLPLLGLLGTVGGLFDSFNGLAHGDQAVLSTGIAEALLTTQLGLTSAVPAVLLLIFCQRHCERFLQETECIDVQ
ncbi:MotA/TolQ/ExbB proton channel family protein [Endozoicomonas euniceicola]|uniref:MotA/TolQ/ExbB proton channel family protein n=1 Tax=Endozoicomonas euniceicola TaxID=1234143 RepID=A0ABY6GPK5_9GAMM|nr:MotA/TolQ/ExbB proton channel family protein [Endozoicomonas euniceicola]UYM14477.1 MotA/TolQ/ExbB proton channel family protein [Endozoicomonas euniceicola]